MSLEIGSVYKTVVETEVAAQAGALADALGRRFVDLVKHHRHLDDERLATVADALAALRQQISARPADAALLREVGHATLERAAARAGVDASMLRFKRAAIGRSAVSSGLATA
mgnify:CR=1 FL=1